MNIHGQFVIDDHLVIPNTVNDELMAGMLAAFCRLTDFSAAGNYYIGLCGNAASGQDATLSSITDEIAVLNGYARQAVSADIAGWPVLEKTDSGYWRVASAQVTFTAAGGDFSAPFTRLFLTDQAAGTVGKLFAISGPKAVADLILSGVSRNVRYELFLR